MTLCPPADSGAYSYDQVEAALCVWEELDRRTRIDADEHPALTEWRDEHGTSALRRVAIGLADHVEAIYQALPAEEWDGLAYDWEIVPAVLDFVHWWAPEGPRPMLSTEAPTAALLAAMLRGEPPKYGHSNRPPPLGGSQQGAGLA
jgi:hypothetical protein